MAETTTLEPTETEDDDSPAIDLTDKHIEVDRAVYEAPIPLDEEIFQPTDLVLDVEAIEIEEWGRFAFNLQRMENGHQFWAGELYAKGHKKWGESVHQFLDERAGRTWESYAYVIGRIPPEIRDRQLEWTHHKHAADLSKGGVRARAKALKMAFEGAKHEAVPDAVPGKPWTTREMLAYVKFMNADNGKSNTRRDKEAGDVTSITYSMDWRVAPADESTADKLAQRMNEAFDAIVEDLGIEILHVGPADKTTNRSKGGAAD